MLITLKCGKGKKLEQATIGAFYFVTIGKDCKSYTDISEAIKAYYKEVAK